MNLLRHHIFEGAQWDTAGSSYVERRTPPGSVGRDLDGGAGMMVARLCRTIEGEIIPRLMANHAADRTRLRGVGPAADLPDGRDVVAFSDILLADDGAAALAFVTDLLSRRVSLETIYLDLMTPTARRLGELWIADVCNFADVTVALGRLQHMLHDLSGTDADLAPVRQYGRRALLVSAPCEQHTFGALMVAEFLRRAGWDVAGEPGASGREIVSFVRNEWFAVVGLSISAEQHVGALAPMIQAIRRASRNAGVVVMVGGNVFLEHPDFVPLVGADATAVDARQVVAHAEKVIARTPGLSTARGGA